jgi:hypothetical protein
VPLNFAHAHGLKLPQNELLSELFAIA